MTKDEYIIKIKDKLTDKDWTAIARARKRKDSLHLYKPDAKEGYDYQECPITGRRMASITGRYIKTLPTTEEEYFRYFPELKEVPEGRKEIDRLAKQKLYVDENGNHIINESTGQPMTVVEVNIMRKMETMKQVGEDGLTGIQRAGMKSREAHLNNIDENGMNGYNRIAQKAIIKGNQTKIDKGIISADNVEIGIFERYERMIEFMVRHIKEDGCIPENVNLARLGQKDIDNPMQIDHRYSITQGFNDKVSPLVIGHVKNCQLLPSIKNTIKHNNCDITLVELLHITKYSLSDSESEFESIFKELEKDFNNKVVHSTTDVLERCGLTSKYFTTNRTVNRKSSL